MERFWDKVLIIPFSECWEWTGSRNKEGYGHFRIANKVVKAHRVSFELKNGPIPKYSLICHKCDNPSCVNPCHLFLGTHKDNKMDCVSKNRHYKYGKPPHVPGEKCGQHFLKEKQVIAIRKEYRNGYGEMTRLAIKYGVTRGSIYRIITRKNWKHI